MDNILRTLCARGESVLVEEFAYPGMSFAVIACSQLSSKLNHFFSSTGTLNAMVPQGLKPVAIKLDHDGVSLAFSATFGFALD